MAMNRIQFQAGLSLPAFLAQFGTDEQCADALEVSRWPQGFCCPSCNTTDYYLLKVGKHKTFQCKCCRLQTSLIAGILFQSTHLALSIWFLAIYLISQAKTGLSALDLNPSLTSAEKHSCESTYYSVLIFFVIDLRVIFSSADQFFGSTGSRVNLQRLINRH